MVVKAYPYVVTGMTNLFSQSDQQKEIEKESPVENDGNFRALLRLRVDAGDLKLSQHLETAKSNAT